MPKKIESKNLIVKSNELIEAKYRLTSTEQKIICILTSSINKDDEDFKPYEIDIKNFIKLLSTKSKSKYSEIKNITKNLMKKVFSIYDKEKKEELQISWFSSVLYKEKQGIVELEFSPKLKPFLLQLKECFTKFSIENIMQLKSGYSCRLYEILKEYEKPKTRIIELNKLREMLGLFNNEYPKYSNLKQKVILVAQKELKTKTDICFEFEEIKKGRKVESIIFYIFPNTIKQSNNIQEINEISATTQDLSKEDEIINILKIKTGQVLSKDIVTKLILEKGFDKVKSYAEEFDEFVYGGTTNIAGLFVAAVKNEYEKPKGKQKKLSNKFYSDDDDVTDAINAFEESWKRRGVKHKKI